MPSCCTSRSTEGTDKFFTKRSRKYLDRFRSKGLAREQRYLLEGITAAGDGSRSVLDIGCGVGGVHLTLLRQGAGKAVGIDISAGMIQFAGQLSKDLGLADRTSYVHGDFVEMADTVPRCDIVVLDKVVCCYENLDALLKKSLAKTGSVYALSFPRSHIFVRLIARSAMTLGKLFRWSFSPYWHDWERMAGIIRAGGFEEYYRKTTVLWTVCAFRRTGA